MRRRRRSSLLTGRKVGIAFGLFETEDPVLRLGGLALAMLADE
jgi:hypothetical protein